MQPPKVKWVGGSKSGRAGDIFLLINLDVYMSVYK